MAPAFQKPHYWRNITKVIKNRISSFFDDIYSQVGIEILIEHGNLSKPDMDEHTKNATFKMTESYVKKLESICKTRHDTFINIIEESRGTLTSVLELELNSYCMTEIEMSKVLQNNVIAKMKEYAEKTTVNKPFEKFYKKRYTYLLPKYSRQIYI